MNEQLGPSRAKYWHEMSADEKIEKLANSVVSKAYERVVSEGKMSLFKSYNPNLIF